MSHPLCWNDSSWHSHFHNVENASIDALCALVTALIIKPILHAYKVNAQIDEIPNHVFRATLQPGK